MLFMCGSVFVTHTAKAQANFVGTSANPTRAILNTSADTAKYTLSAPYSIVSIEAKVTKSSGTMAGKIYVWGSVGGVLYTVLDSASLSNSATQYATFNFTNRAWRYWLVIQSGGTNVAGILNAKVDGAGR